MDAASSLTLRWVPRRIHLVVISANHRSTRFIHDEEVGVKWNSKRGWRTSHRWMDGVLWVELLSSTTWTVRPAGTVRSMRFRNFWNSTARWRAVSWWVTTPVARFNAAYRSMVPCRT